MADVPCLQRYARHKRDETLGDSHLFDTESYDVMPEKCEIEYEVCGCHFVWCSASKLDRMTCGHGCIARNTQRFAKGLPFRLGEKVVYNK